MALAVDPDFVLDALDDLRDARRQRRLESWNIIDALYRAYVAAIASVLAVVAVSGAVGDTLLSRADIASAARNGPGVVGLAVALAVAAGLRSGSRGGPLTVEEAEVRHVLLAPVDRRAALAGPARRQLRSSLFAGVAVGGAGGLVAYHRLGANPAAWIACGALVGGATGLAVASAGYAASGIRLRPAAATALGGFLLAWTAVDVVATTTTSPASLVGAVALWPLRMRPLGVIGLVLAVALAAFGVTRIGGLSVEAAARRGRLVTHLRFAATFQDLRTVLLLRRQLALEVPRERPWVRLPRRGRWPVWRRDWHGIVRWPVPRLLRLAFLGAAAGAATAGAWAGTKLLVVVAGVCLFVAALDATEGLSQDLDHPDRRDSLPIEEGALNLRHLAAPVVVMTLVALVGVAVAAAFDASLAVRVGPVLALPCAAAAVGAAAVSSVRNRLQPSVMLTDATGLMTLYYQGLPPALATAGPALALVARARVVDHGAAPAAAAASSAIWVVVLAVLMFGWVHQRAAINEFMGEALRGPK